MTASAALPALLTFALTLAFTPVVIALLRRRQVIDHPNDRSNHTLPTVRGAGLAVAAAALLGAVVAPDIAAAAGITLVSAAAAFALIGALDDTRRGGLHVRIRLGAQLVVAMAAGAALVADSRPALPIIVIAVAALWTIAYVNAFNFMDGINGISVGQATVAGAALAYAGIQADVPLLTAGGAVLAAATVGFAPYNFPRARAFIGDVGSYFIGSWLALLAVIAVLHGVTAIAVAAPFALYAADTATTLARRVARGEVWYEAHKEHTYQRLVALGWSHTRTTLTVTAFIAASAAAGAVTLHTTDAATAAIATTAIVAVTAVYLGLPALVAPTPRRQPATGVQQ